MRLHISLWLVCSCDYQKRQQLDSTVSASRSLRLCSLSITPNDKSSFKNISQKTFCFQDNLSVFKAFRLNVFKCPYRENHFFLREVCLWFFFFFCCCFFFFFFLFFRGKSGNLARLKMELFVTIVNNFQPLHVLQKELHLICGRVPKFTSVFFSFFCGRKTY